MISFDGHITPGSKERESPLGSLFSPHAASLERVRLFAKTIQTFGSLGKKSAEFFSDEMLAVREVYLRHYIRKMRDSGRMHIVTVASEEGAILLSLNQMEALGCSVKLAPVDSCGRVDLEKFREMLGPRVSLVTLSWVCCLSGVVQPIEEIAAVCKELGISLHVDLSHGLWKAGDVWQEIEAAYITCDSSKFLQPLRQEMPAALFSVEDSLTPRDLQLSLALKFSELFLEAEGKKDLFATEVARKKRRFEELLKQTPGVFPLFEECERAPHISLISFRGIHAEALAFLLSQKGIYVSLGGGVVQQVGSFLKGLGYEEEIADTALSFSISPEMQEIEIERGVAEIQKGVGFLKWVRGSL